MMHGGDQTTLAEAQSRFAGQMPEGDVMQIMFGGRVGQEAIALFKFREHARRFGPKDSSACRTATMAEFVNDFFDLDRHDFGEVSITNVKILQRHLAIGTDVLGVERNDRIGLRGRNDSSAVTAMAHATTAVVALGFGVGFEGFLGRRRR